MVEWGLAVTAALALAASVLYIAVGTVVLRRRPRSSLAGPNVAFGAGWILLGAMLFGDGVRVALAVTGPPWIALYTALVEAKIIVTAAALACLGYYVLFLWAGRSWTWIPMAVLGLAHAFFFLALTRNAAPYGVEVGAWSTRLITHGTNAFPGGKAVGAAAFFLPFLILTALYLGLWGRATSRALRARLTAVGVSLVLLLAASTIQSNPDVSADTPILPVAWVVIAAAGLLSLWSFAPPTWLAHRLRPTGDEPMAV